jgi:hypothetical protein
LRPAIDFPKSDDETGEYSKLNQSGNLVSVVFKPEGMKGQKNKIPGTHHTYQRCDNGGADTAVPSGEKDCRPHGVINVGCAKPR